MGMRIIDLRPEGPGRKSPLDRPFSEGKESKKSLRPFGQRDIDLPVEQAEASEQGDRGGFHRFVAVPGCLDNNEPPTSAAPTKQPHLMDWAAPPAALQNQVTLPSAYQSATDEPKD